jgi:hypothetical protein
MIMEFIAGYIVGMIVTFMLFAFFAGRSRT